MGSSYWFDCMDKPNPEGEFHCNPNPSDPFQPVPVPLLANFTPIAQPAGLYTIAKRYAAAAVEFIITSAQAGTPFLLYFPFNHVHAPDSCGEDFCGKSARGPIGDAVEEMDWTVGQVMTTLKNTRSGRANASEGGEPSWQLLANNTIVFFTVSGAPLSSSDVDPSAACCASCTQIRQ